MTYLDVVLLVVIELFIILFGVWALLYMARVEPARKAIGA